MMEVKATGIVLSTGNTTSLGLDLVEIGLLLPLPGHGLSFGAGLTHVEVATLLRLVLVEHVGISFRTPKTFRHIAPPFIYYNMNSS
jgi:hypothetical protein